MGIFSNGTTNITYDTDESIKDTIEKTTKRTGGGNLRTITSGERVEFRIDIRVTPTEYRALLELLKDGNMITVSEIEKSRGGME